MAVEDGARVHDAAWEGDVLELVRSGDPTAFGELVQEFGGDARRFARSLVAGSEVDDLVSEVFARLFAVLRAGGGPTGRVQPYLFRAIRNRAIDVYRGRVAGQQTVGDGVEESTPDASEPVLRAQLVRRALSSLPPRWQQVLWMLHVEQADRHEVAEELGIRPGAVSQLALRAREGFRAAYLAQYARLVPDECRDVASLLPQFVLGKLNAADDAIVREHVNNCEACYEIVIEMGSITRYLNGGALIAASGAILGLSWAVPGSGGGAPGQRILSLRSGALIGAAVITACGLATLAWAGAAGWRTPPVTSSASVAETATVGAPHPPGSAAAEPHASPSSTRRSVVLTEPTPTRRPLTPPRPSPSVSVLPTLSPSPSPSPSVSVSVLPTLSPTVPTSADPSTKEGRVIGSHRGRSAR